MTQDEAREELQERVDAHERGPEPVPAEADPEDFKPAGGELVVQVPEEVFTVLDRHDESQILEEMQRRVLEVSLYDFPQGGSRLIDLSYSGVREVVHLMNRTGKCRLRVMPGSLSVSEVVEDDEPHYVADVWAEDAVTGEAFLGTATEPKRMKITAATARKWKEKGKAVPEDRMVWDTFARTKAVNKAQRNALKQFIPEQIRQTLIAQYAKDPARIRVIEAGAGAAAEAALPPPLDTPEAEALRKRARAIFDEIKAADRLALLPGAFHQRLSRASSSLESLESFCEALEAKRDELVSA